MKIPLKFIFLVTVIITCCFCACVEDRDICEETCEMEEECAEISEKMFSYRRCVRDCRDSMEQYESVRCGDDFWDYLDCVSGLRCSDLDDVSNECASDIDHLNSCVN